MDVKFDLFNGEGSTKLINKFERFGELHQKDNLYRNMWFHCRVIPY